jgi:hypothetical protein
MLGGCADMSLLTETLTPDQVPLEGEARILINGSSVYSGALYRSRKDPRDTGLTEIGACSWQSYFNRIWSNYIRNFGFSSNRRAEALEVVNRMISLTPVPFTAHAENATLTNATSIGVPLSGGIASALEAIGRRVAYPGATWGIDHNKAIYCKPMITTVAAAGNISYAQLITHSLERDSSQLVNMIQATGLKPQAPYNCLKNPFFLDVENSSDRYFYYTSPAVLKAYVGLFKGWTICLQAGDGSVGIANTYNLPADSFVRPDSKYAFAFGDYGADITSGSDGTTLHVTEVRPQWSNYGAGLATGTDVFSREEDARPKVRGGAMIAVSARIWKDSTAAPVQMRWTVKTYSGSTLLSTFVQPSWTVLTNGWNFASTEGSATGWTCTADAAADSCMPILEIKPVNLNTSTHVIIDGLICVSPYFTNIWLTPDERFCMLFAVDNSFMSTADARVKSSITDYGYKLKALDFQGDDVQLAKDFCSNYFNRFSLPFWRGTVTAGYREWPGYYPWQGRVQLHNLPATVDYSRLSTDGSSPVFDCQRVDYSVTPDDVVASYSLQSAGVLQELTGDLQELGYYPLPTLPDQRPVPLHALTNPTNNIGFMRGPG